MFEGQPGEDIVELPYSGETTVDGIDVKTVSADDDGTAIHDELEARGIRVEVF